MTGCSNWYSSVGLITQHEAVTIKPTHFLTDNQVVNKESEIKGQRQTQGWFGNDAGKNMCVAAREI